MAWGKCDDTAWSNEKLRRAGRSARGLFWDLVSYTSKGRDGYIAADQLDLVGAAPADPDLKKLLRERLLHKRGDECACLTRRDWEWPAGRGYLLHDFLVYNPSRAETDVARAQDAERKDPALRAAARIRDFGRCRYCSVKVGPPSDRRSPIAENLDHIDPELAAGLENVVISCKSCNSAKKKRTPEQALMPLLEVADIRAKHFADLGIADPEANTEPTPEPRSDPGPTQVRSQVRTLTDRDGYGSGRVGFSDQVGPPTTKRDSVHPNPYMRAGHGDPSLEPPPPGPDPPPARAAPAADPRSQRPQKRKGRRR